MKFSVCPGSAPPGIWSGLLTAACPAWFITFAFADDVLVGFAVTVVCAKAGIAVTSATTNTTAAKIINTFITPPFFGHKPVCRAKSTWR
jgi:hypothetical protein